MTRPHQNLPLVHAGASLDDARAVLVLVHGRGASPESILPLLAAASDGQPWADHVAALAPTAAGGAWYPSSFLAPTTANEPGLSSGLAAITQAIAVIEAVGVPRERIVVGGFSQGACLASEWAARNAAGGPLGGVVVLSGGLIGRDGDTGQPPPHDKAFAYDGDLGGTPVFLGCSDVDGHIPVERVFDSAEAFEALGAEVTTRIYPGMGHLINDDEIGWLRDRLAELVDADLPD